MSRRPQNLVMLPSGIRVAYSIVQRHPDPYLFIRFRSPDGRRLEKTTKVTSIKKVAEVAAAIIAEEYGISRGSQIVGWEEAIPKARAAMVAGGLRETTIGNYLDTTLAVLRRFRPASVGPGDFSDKTAREFKIWMAEQKWKDGSPRYMPSTVSSYLNVLSVIWSTWFIGELKCDLVDPWRDVKPPKADKEDKRILSEEEEEAFFGWLKATYGEIRIAFLYVLAKLLVGCRSMDLASLETNWLKDGRICFPPGAVKGRESREAILPAWLFNELKGLAGPVYVFQNFSDQLIAYYRRRGGYMKRSAYRVKPFTPKQLHTWLQEMCQRYNKLQAEKDSTWVPFTLHNLRGTSMSRYLDETNGDFQGAAIAYDCSVETMKRHYAKIDRTKISDEVFRRVQSRYQEDR